MTTHDQNKKTLRHFQCRDYLWEIFEQMSTELECSTDYLINEAMRQYARSRNYGTARSGQREDAANPSTNPQAANAGGNGIPSLRESPVARSAAPSPPPPRPRSATPIHSSAAPHMSNAPTPPPARPRTGSHAAAPVASSLPPPPPPPNRVPPPRPPASVSNPPPLPGGGRSAPQPTTARSRQLFIIFNGQKIPVTKEEFVIGRGSKSADLAIKDGNISRRHAAVVIHNGAHYLKDLGSTNGVEFQGRRFDSKRIEEGDMFRICDYELRFTYQ
ncbi:MAG TPA: FHA domain-containing protein [Polyangiales bacterium]|nr:FHA domain-containing protein [Polyangiales bacterium]